MGRHRQRPAPHRLPSTPPLARINGEEQQLLRVIYEGQGMPTDRESVVWLNVQEIPQASKTAEHPATGRTPAHQAVLPPAGLKNAAYLAPTELMWSLAERAGKPVLVVTNPGLYHVSIAEITLQSAPSKRPL